MELQDVIRGAGTCRFFLEDDVPDDVLAKLFDSARFAPQGGNRQPVRWIVVRDPETRRRLKDLYLPLWKADLEQYLGGSLTTGAKELAKAVADSDHFAEHFDEAPVIVVACAEVAELHPQCLTDGGLNMLAGASVYPMVQNLLLALRDRGVATTLTTLICNRESEVKDVLGLPDGVVSACHIAAGYPSEPFPSRLTRRPVEELVFAERYGAARS